MRVPQVASWPFSHSLNTSWQQTAWPSDWNSASMKSTVRPSSSKPMRSPSFHHCGVMDLIILTFFPSAVFSIISCAILGFVPAYSCSNDNSIKVHKLCLMYNVQCGYLSGKVSQNYNQLYYLKFSWVKFSHQASLHSQNLNHSCTRQAGRAELQV